MYVCMYVCVHMYVFVLYVSYNGTYDRMAWFWHHWIHVLGHDTCVLIHPSQLRGVYPTSIGIGVSDPPVIPSPRSYENHPPCMIPMECGNSRPKTMVSLNGGVKCMNGGWDCRLFTYETRWSCVIYSWTRYAQLIATRGYAQLFLHMEICKLTITCIRVNLRCPAKQ